MSKNSTDHFKKMAVKNEHETTPEVRVMKLDPGTAPVVEQYNFEKIYRQGEGSYSATKAKYGALAATDPERTRRNQKDRRFSLNHLLRDPLSIEEEERRVIDERVRVQILALSEQAKAKADFETAKGLKEKK